eukprot:403357073
MDLNLENTCIICDESFNLKTKSPYLLPCKEHTACKLCLSEAKDSGETELLCPIDSTSLKLSQLKSLSKNMQIVAFLKKQKPQSISQSLQSSISYLPGNNNGLVNNNAGIKESKWLQEVSVISGVQQSDQSSFIQQNQSKIEEEEDLNKSDSAVLDISNANISKRSKKKKKKKKRKGDNSLLQSMLQDPKNFLDQTGLNPIMEESNDISPGTTKSHNAISLGQTQNQQAFQKIQINNVTQSIHVQKNQNQNEASKYDININQASMNQDLNNYQILDSQRSTSIFKPNQSQNYNPLMTMISDRRFSNMQMQQSYNGNPLQNNTTSQNLLQPQLTISTNQNDKSVKTLQPNMGIQVQTFSGSTAIKNMKIEDQLRKSQVEFSSKSSTIKQSSTSQSNLIKNSQQSQPIQPQQQLQEQKSVNQVISFQENYTPAFQIREGECAEHLGEDYRHLCLDHNKLLCPKCLIKHKTCDFKTSNETFVFENKQRLRQLLKELNNDIQKTIAQKQSIEIAQEEVLNYKEQNIEMINFMFSQLFIELETRKQQLIEQIENVVRDIDCSLKSDRIVISDKEQKQNGWLNLTKEIQRKIYEDQEQNRENIRVLIEWENINKLETDLSQFQNQNQNKFLASQVYETPRSTFKLDLGKFNKQVNQLQQQPDRPTSNMRTAQKKIIWFKWGSYEAFKFDAKNDRWNKIEAKPINPYLYFSSIVHLTNQRGALMIGGSDEDANYYRRVVHFENYQIFKDKAPMISKRAFFCSLHCQCTDQVFAFGGNDGEKDLKQVELYDMEYNNWVELPSMQQARNGASCVIFEKYRTIFLFGGANIENGSLDSIEKFSMQTQVWEIINIKLVKPLHDFVCHSIGKNRILILGQPDPVQQNPDQEDLQQSQRAVEQDVELQIIDLSYHLQNQCSVPKSMGQTYLPTFLDACGFLYIFTGYLDNKPTQTISNIKSLIQLQSVNMQELFDKQKRQLQQQ